MDKDKTDKNVNLFSDTAIIGAITLLGYLCTCLFRYGYLISFHIPSYLIEINLTHVLLASIVIITILLIMVFIVDFFLKIDFSNKSLFLKRTIFFITYCGVTILPLIFLANNPSDPYNKVKVSLLLFIILLVILCVSLKYYFNIRGKVELEKINKMGLIDRFHSIYGAFPLLGIFLSIMALVYSFFVGIYTARNQDTFLITLDDKPAIIISTYTDYLITIEIDKKNKNLTNNISLINKSNLYAKNEKIGFMSNKDYSQDKLNILIKKIISILSSLKRYIYIN